MNKNQFGAFLMLVLMFFSFQAVGFSDDTAGAPVKGADTIVADTLKETTETVIEEKKESIKKEGEEVVAPIQDAAVVAPSVEVKN